jgi:hypothetical protein
MDFCCYVYLEEFLWFGHMMLDTLSFRWCRFSFSFHSTRSPAKQMLTGSKSKSDILIALLPSSARPESSAVVYAASFIDP